MKTAAPVDLTRKQVRILGTGNMGEAMLRGLLKSRAVTPDHIIVTGRREERLEALAAAYHVRVTEDNAQACEEADVVIVAVKPQVLDRLLEQIAQPLPARTLVISVAAGVSTAAIEAHLRPGTHVCRAMPNTPAIVGAGATAIAAGCTASAEDMRVASAIFRAVGTVTQVDESLLDAVTGLSGCGPAYVFLIIEALADAGVKVGLPRYQALELAAQTMLGSAKLLQETGQHPGVLKDQVTSPGGAAIAGLHTLEQGGLRTTLINAVVTAAARSGELGQLASKKKT